MFIVRIVSERLLLALFGIVRSAFLAYALAGVTALLAVSAWGGPEAPGWLGVLTRACLMTGAIFFVSAILLFVAPLLRARARGENDGRPAWIWLLALSLLVLPVLSHERTSGLVALWREILVLLESIGFWEWDWSGQFSGIVLMPILAALFVPALEAAAACFLIAVPLGLFALLVTRSRLFPRSFAMLVVCQAGLVLASLVAADAFARLADDLIAAMTAAEDAEVQRAAATLERASGVLTATASAFVAPLLGYLAWLPVLSFSRQVGSFFDAGAKLAPAPAPASSAAAIEPSLARPTPPARAPLAATPERTPVASATRSPDRRARIALLALGALLLLHAGSQALRVRAVYVSSEPPPGATLSAVPPAVRVRFGRALDPSSQLWVDRTRVGEAVRVGASSGLDPSDPQHRTLVVALSDDSDGVYQVGWRTQPASGGVARSGSLRFAVRMAVPEPLADEPPLRERDAKERAQRQTVAGGVLLILLGALLPRLGRRT